MPYRLAISQYFQAGDIISQLALDVKQNLSVFLMDLKKVAFYSFCFVKKQNKESASGLSHRTRSHKRHVSKQIKNNYLSYVIRLDTLRAIPISAISTTSEEPP